MGKKKGRIEEFEIDGDKVVVEVKKLLHEGKIRRITIKNEKGETLLEIPLLVGIIGAALLPVLAAVGALGALVARLRIVVEKVEE
jgi:CBS domain-containing protein